MPSDSSKELQFRGTTLTYGAVPENGQETMNTRASHRARAAWYRIVAAGLVACALSWTIQVHQAYAEGLSPSGSAATAPPPNIIFILVDDFSMNLLPYMLDLADPPHSHGLQDMVNTGTTFTNYFVSNSLCCPSRSSIFTGKYPHNTGVFTNVWAPNATPPLTDGGFGAFLHYGNQAHTFALALQDRGKYHGKYVTSMLGKFLNQYLTDANEPYNKNRAWTLNWGWDNWRVADKGYLGFNYNLNENGAVNYYGAGDVNYMTHVLSSRAQDFISAHTHRPFFLEVATFAPHHPYTPANADQQKFPGLRLPVEVGNYQNPVNAPDWQIDIPALLQTEVEQMNADFRKRAQSVQAIDKMISDIRTLLKKKGLDTNTYVFFSADNGYHMGEFNFLAGKMTPYEFDINVPLIVVGPGVPHQTLSAIAQNVDLAPTFTELAQLSEALPTDPDGASLLPLLQGQKPSVWRKMALIEHHGPRPDDLSDPDNEQHERKSGATNPPNYAALRIMDVDSIVATPVNAMYVEYEGRDEKGSPVVEPCYYDLTKDPYERINIYQSLPQERRLELQALLGNLRTCGHAGKPTCWTVQQ